MKETDNKIDAKLLQDTFNPFYQICEVNRDSRDQSHEYRAFKDSLQFIKIIGIRLIIDSIKHEKTRHRNALTEYELQLDSDSFVIFSRILLDNVGTLMDKLLSCRNADKWFDGFTMHRDYYLKNKKLCRKYSKILGKMHWYDQNFNYLRNKIVVHGGSLAGSMSNFVVYSKINSSFGRLSNKDQQTVQKFINRYGQKNNEILSIQANPYLMLDEFLSAIMESNTKLWKRDKTKLGKIVQTTGANIDVTVLSGHLRVFLEEIANLFK